MNKKLTNITIEKWRKIISLSVISFLFLLSIFIYFFKGKPLIEFVRSSDEVRSFVTQKPIISRLFFTGVIFLQVIFAIIPGEPFEIAAGYAFGAVEGSIICMFGILIASVLIFLAVKKYGRFFIELFFPPKKIDDIKIFQNKAKLNFIIFIVFFIPGTPKDILTYMVGLTPIKLKDWIFITTLARIPSIITSTIAGSVLASQNSHLAFYVFAISGVLATLGMLCFYFWNKKNLKKL